METWTRGYNAATSIAELSVEVADAVDREGTYETAAFHATGLPDVWFSGERTSRDIPTDGCVSVDCRLIGSGRRSHGLLIFLAHLAPSASADDLAEAARQASRGDTPQVAIASGHRLANHRGVGDRRSRRPRVGADPRALLRPHRSILVTAKSPAQQPRTLRLLG